MCGFAACFSRKLSARVIFFFFPAERFEGRTVAHRLTSRQGQQGWSNYWRQEEAKKIKLSLVSFFILSIARISTQNVQHLQGNRSAANWHVARAKISKLTVEASTTSSLETHFGRER
jgi:hypothetical protein